MYGTYNATSSTLQDSLGLLERRQKRLYLHLLKSLFILPVIHGNKPTNVYESEQFELQFKQIFYLKWLTQLGHSLGLVNRGGAVCRFTVIHLETKCAYKQQRGEVGFDLFFFFLIYISQFEYRFQKKLHYVWIYLKWL